MKLSTEFESLAEWSPMNLPIVYSISICHNHQLNYYRFFCFLFDALLSLVNPGDHIIVGLIDIIEIIYNMFFNYVFLIVILLVNLFLIELVFKTQIKYCIDDVQYSDILVVYTFRNRPQKFIQLEGCSLCKPSFIFQRMKAIEPWYQQDHFPSLLHHLTMCVLNSSFPVHSQLSLTPEIKGNWSQACVHSLERGIKSKD